VHREPQKREVPAELLDLRRVLANYEDVIGNILADAEKRWITDQIEIIAKETKENGHES